MMAPTDRRKKAPTEIILWAQKMCIRDSISEKDFTDKIEEIPKAFIKCLVEYFNNK